MSVLQSKRVRTDGAYPNKRPKHEQEYPTLADIKSLRRNRGKSPEAFLKYMCYTKARMLNHKASQRANEEFYQHCLDLYKKQNGRCALTGLSMTHVHGNDIPTNISIDRIDINRGYEVGNVRLVRNAMNIALSVVGEDGFGPMAAAFLEHFEGCKVVWPKRRTKTGTTNNEASATLFPEGNVSRKREAEEGELSDEE